MDISSTEKILTDQKTELTDRITGIEKDFKSGRSADSKEQAIEMENEEVLTELLREAKEELGQVTQALQSLKDGRYGICVKCGEEINNARLNAIPYTTKCINCAT